MSTTTTRQTSGTEDVLPQPGSPYRHLWPHLAVVAVALGLWVVSLRQIDLGHLGTIGLVSVFPLTWWGSLALLVVGMVVATASRASRLRPAPLYIAAFLLVLYATAPLLEGTTR